ncbi:putative aminopeptidase W07G4.4 [Drosophila innubila]|uniref:putative aminopeptidase W07G4.4 n=1 Tax=Drosophila innubila TaxID=198719 RepID=UPI00148C01F7|nr:putative aminopeptidase W07G4.4 [Drosophila innubila]XP_034486470.1 putative aminopeptidase W07G4.4 [Drosophila innubila]
MSRLDKLLPCSVKLSKILGKSGHDVLCIIDRAVPAELADTFEEHRSYDKAFDSVVSCFKSPRLDLPVIYAPVAELTDYADVRCYQKAAAQSLQRAIKSGFRSPLLVVPQSKRFTHAELCTVLGALEGLYVPIQLREDVPEKKQRISSLSVMINNPNAEEIIKDALLLESGRHVARDIGIGDPERMAPSSVEAYIKPLFDNLKVTVIDDVNVINKEYPLFGAVNRAANMVKRHQGRIIYLEYIPPTPARKTLLLVGKGVTYDTGGADIKAGGIMAGMSRDKCGAAAVAGFMQVVSQQQPKDIHVIGALCMVRNSVGEECYVADEIITSRAGVRVRVGNTDAEGRMCMADVLCRMKELVIEGNLPNPHIFSIATLTGHAFISAGEGQSIIVDNSVAAKADHARKLQAAGQVFGEPFEVSVLRQCDFDFNAGRVIGEDVVQSNNLPSVRTPRGHQVPAAFMIKATGLDKHGLDSSKPIRYSHLDIAGSAGEYPDMPTAAPIVALAKTHLID